jgi:hypothetical protein
VRNSSTKVTEEIKTRISCSITTFAENHALYEVMCEKYDKSETGHRFCAPVTYGRRSTLRICNTYSFSTATMAM